MTSPGPTTLPGAVAHFAKVRPTAVALREKRLGLWAETTWAEYGSSVRAAARMLWELGVRAGDHVGIISENRTEWLYADLGAQGIGARSVGIYQTNPAADVAYVLSHCQASVLFCEDQEQLDKTVEIAALTPTVKHVIVFDPRGTRYGTDSRVIQWKDFLAQGLRLTQEAPAWFDEKLAALDPKAPAMVVYTSGTTGQPKGALISSRNVMEVGRQAAEIFGCHADDVLLSYLPLCHVAEKIFTLFIPLRVGAVVHFGESITTVRDDLREVSPSVFLGVPRIWEKMHTGVTLRMQDASWLKRHLFAFFAGRGRAIAARRRAAELTWRDRILWRLGDLLVFRPLQERLGLRRCRLPVTGAAPIAADLIEWFHALGIPLVEGYGQTECAGVSHGNSPAAMKIGSVGRRLPDVECRLGDDGEVLVRGASVFGGYLHDPEATARAIDADGWLATGDVGVVDTKGYLTITGRKKEIIITAGGKNLSPERIENVLKLSAYIKEAVAIGDRRRFVAALVQIDYDAVSDWAARRRLAHSSFEDLVQKPEVRILVDGEIQAQNALLARVEQVRVFRFFPKELHQDDGELTPTQKVRRHAIVELYEELIESMYAPKEVAGD